MRMGKGFDFIFVYLSINKKIMLKNVVNYKYYIACDMRILGGVQDL